jgi:hypothetical protein
MVIPCPSCEISFSPSHQVCPKCKQYRPDLKLRKEYLCDEAQHDLESGIAPEEVEERLIAEGLPPSEARQICNERWAIASSEARGYGAMRLAIGGLLIFLAIVLATPAVVAIANGHRAGRLLVLAGICFVAGLRVTVLGGFNLWSGRE